MNLITGTMANVAQPKGFGSSETCVWVSVTLTPTTAVQLMTFSGVSHQRRYNHLEFSRMGVSTSNIWNVLGLMYSFRYSKRYERLSLNWPPFRLTEQSHFSPRNEARFGAPSLDGLLRNSSCLVCTENLVSGSSITKHVPLANSDFLPTSFSQFQSYLLPTSPRFRIQQMKSQHSGHF